MSLVTEWKARVNGWAKYIEKVSFETEVTGVVQGHLRGFFLMMLPKNIFNCWLVLALTLPFGSLTDLTREYSDTGVVPAVFFQVIILTTTFRGFLDFTSESLRANKNIFSVLIWSSLLNHEDWGERVKCSCHFGKLFCPLPLSAGSGWNGWQQLPSAEDGYESLRWRLSRKTDRRWFKKMVILAQKDANRNSTFN